MLDTLKTYNCNKRFLFVLILSFIGISNLQCSSLQMLYTAKFRHVYIVPMPFIVHQLTDEFQSDKSQSFQSKLSNIFPVNVTVRPLFLKNLYLDHIPFNNNTFNFLSIDCSGRPRWVHIQRKIFYAHPLYIYIWREEFLHNPSELITLNS